jgi:hypothetical protein
VKIIYANDKDRGPGHGILTISQTRLALLPLEGCRFTVLRAGDKRCLVPGGWQEAETPLTPLALAQDGDVRLYVGAEVVDLLDEQEVYRVTLIAPDGERDAGTLELRGLVYSPLAGDGNLVGFREPAATAKPAVAPPKPEPEAVAPPPPPGPQPGTEPEPKPETIIDPDPRLDPRGSARKRRFLLLAGLLVLLLLSGLAWYFFFHGQGKAPAEAPGTEAAATRPEAPSAAPAPEPTAAPKAEAPPLERARAFLRDKGTPDKALDLSRTMPESPDGRDAAFLLLESAAEAGLGEAMTALARFYDPTDTAPGGTIQKDAEQAWLWYAKAKAAGQAEAGRRLDALAAWLRQEADKGDARARELLGRLR